MPNTLHQHSVFMAIS